MKKFLGLNIVPALAGLALTGLLATMAAPAHARVSVSLGVSLPLAPGVVIGGAVSNRGYWRPPMVIAPAPVIYPAPILYPAPVVYAPRRTYYGPPRVIVRPRPVMPVRYAVPGERWRR